MWGTDEGLHKHILLEWAEPYAGPRGLIHMEVKGNPGQMRTQGVGEVCWRAWWWGSAQSCGTVFLWSKAETLNNVETVHYSLVLCADYYRGLPLRLAKTATWPAVCDKPASSTQMSDRHALRYWGTAGASTRVSRAHLPSFPVYPFSSFPRHRTCQSMELCRAEDSISGGFIPLRQFSLSFVPVFKAWASAVSAAMRTAHRYSHRILLENQLL